MATAEALDEEMAARIAKHRADRGAEFTTIEEPLEIARRFARYTDVDAIVVDCLTLWLSNIMQTFGRNVESEVETLGRRRASEPGTVIPVTNEVGCGIVPENALAREFRDRAGFLNQRMAEAAREVYWMVFGQPLRIK